MGIITKVVRSLFYYIFNFRVCTKCKENRTWVRSNISLSIIVRVIKTIIRSAPIVVNYLLQLIEFSLSDIIIHFNSVFICIVNTIIRTLHVYYWFL